MGRPLRTALAGFGKMGVGYTADPLLAKYFPYATHAQVLADHPAFSWDAVMDLSAEALDIAKTTWKVPFVARDAGELLRQYSPEVIVLATPPGDRLGLIKQFPDLRAVIVEKPLGLTVEEARLFLEYSAKRGLLVQVNLWRRADSTFRGLAQGGLEEMIGRVQAVFGVYGNGLLNNGTHMVDLVRMLFGEITEVQSVRGFPSYVSGPLKDDINPSFSLIAGPEGPTVMMQPVRFSHYRENGLDIWGEKGRLSILMEGLGVIFYPRCDNRSTIDEREIASDDPRSMAGASGRALYDMYENLSSTLAGKEELWSPGASALQTSVVVEAILESVRRDGAPVRVKGK